MDGRSYTLIAVLAFAGSAFAGCIEAPEFLSSADAEATALDHADLAADAAAAWHKDAKLASVMTIETTESMDERIPNDPDVGNGRALAWWYAYCLETEEDMEVRVFRVTADGQVTTEEGTEMLAAEYGMDMEALEGLASDSDDVLAAAKSNDTFRAAAEGFNATVVQGAAVMEGMPGWWIAAASADGLVIAMVDDATGELVEVMPIDMDFEIPTWTMESAGAMTEWQAEPVHLEGEGTVGGDGSTMFPFSVGAPSAGVLALEIETTFPTDGVHWAIYDADEELVDSGMLGMFSDHDGEFEIEIEDAGDYTLAFHDGGFAPLPISEAPAFAFMLHLEPGLGHEHEDDDDQ